MDGGSLIFEIHTLNNCLYQIDNNLISKQTEFIKQRFPFEIFAKNINDTMVSVSKEAFLL